MTHIRLIHWNPAEAQERATRLPDDEFDVDHAPLNPPACEPYAPTHPTPYSSTLAACPPTAATSAYPCARPRPPVGFPSSLSTATPPRLRACASCCPTPSIPTGPTSSPPCATPSPTRPPSPSCSSPAWPATPVRPCRANSGIKPGYAIALPGEPDDFEATLGDLPDPVTLRRRVQGRCDLIVWFVGSRRQLRQRVQRYGARAGPGGLWICWPKKASGVKTDLSERVVRETGLANGLVDYKIAAIDQTWSGLRFTRRKPR